jgi:hypothetical protein
MCRTKVRLTSQAAQQSAAPDCLQRPLRSRFRQQVSTSVRGTCRPRGARVDVSTAAGAALAMPPEVVGGRGSPPGWGSRACGGVPGEYAAPPNPALEPTAPRVGLWSAGAVQGAAAHRRRSAHTLNHQLLAESLSTHDNAHPLQKWQKSLSRVLKSLLDFRVDMSVYAQPIKSIEGFEAKEKRFSYEQGRDYCRTATSLASGAA